MNIIRAVALAAVALLAGCQTTGIPAQQQLYNACADYQAVLDAVVTHGELGNLTLEQLETVAEIDAVPGALCQGDLRMPDGERVTPAQALRAIEDAYLDLLVIQREAGQ